MLCSFLPWTGTGNMIPGSDKIPGSRDTAASAAKNPLDTRFAESAKVQLGETILWSELWRGWRLWRQWFSHSGHCLTPACLPFLQYWWSIWTGLQREGHINWQDWQDIELAQVLVFFRHSKSCSMPCSFLPWIAQVLVFFRHSKSCSMLCSFLPWTGTGNMIAGRDRIPRSLNTAASATKESSQHKVWGVCQAQAFSAFNIAKETLFIDLIWQGWKLWRDRFSHKGHWLAPAFVLFLRDWSDLNCFTDVWARHWTRACACSSSNMLRGRVARWAW